jgi:hypothetical protein
MSDMGMAQQLAFIAEQRHEDEATILVHAMRQGVQVLYHEALIEGYLSNHVSHEMLVRELGIERVTEIEYQRDALQRDIAWGMRHV